MSIDALKWAMKKPNLKPSTKAVLLALAERHTPENGCFPSHATLAEDACMSERCVRMHLDLLEGAGLLVRRKGTGGKGPNKHTRYILEFEADFVPCESRRQILPTAKNDQSRRQILPTIVNIDSKEEEDARGAPDSDQVLLSDLLLAVGHDPAGPIPGWWQSPTALDHLRRWRSQHGLTDAEIIETAEATRVAHPEPPDGPKALDRAMERRGRAKAAAGKDGQAKAAGGAEAAWKKPRQRGEASSPPVVKRSEAEVLAHLAKVINGDCFIPSSTISNGWAQKLLHSGLVTADRMRQRGLGYLVPDGRASKPRSVSAMA